MISIIQRHFALHFRFYAALAIAAIAAAINPGGSGPFRLIASGDAFFVVYLMLTLPLVRGATPERHRNRASYPDEGAFVIFLIIAAMIAVSLAGIFAILNRNEHTSPFALALAIAAAPLGWIMFHTAAAFHYAHRFYSRGDQLDGEPRDAAGLIFPNTEEPVAWDFIYYSFVIGMTAQVSDVQISDTSMRRRTLFHSAASFFFNTVILALAVNVVINGPH